mgnify:CR=1 FL=1
MMFSLENGKFIKTIGNIGQGGNEYILSYDRPVFWADNSEHYIFVKSADDKIQQYDSIGNYVRYNQTSQRNRSFKRVVTNSDRRLYLFLPKLSI